MTSLPPDQPPEPTGVASQDLDDLWAAVATFTVDQDRTWSQRLSELPTERRQVLLTLGGIAAGGVALALQGPRADASTLLTLMDAPLALLLGSALLLPALALRPLHASPPGGWTSALVAIGLLTPTALALLAWPGVTLPIGGAWIHGACLTATLCTTSAVMTLGCAFSRHERRVGWRLALGCAAGGAVAFAAQVLHCPVNDLGHQLLTHGSAGVLVWASLAWRARAPAVCDTRR